MVISIMSVRVTLQVTLSRPSAERVITPSSPSPSSATVTTTVALLSPVAGSKVSQDTFDESVHVTKFEETARSKVDPLAAVTSVEPSLIIGDSLFL